MARTIVLTKDIESRLDTLPMTREEVNGILLYRQRGEYCPIDKCFIMGIGNEGLVTYQKDRIKVANEFLRRNKDYHYVMFHTHTMGTIRRHGDYFARNFSRDDIDEFRRIGFDANDIGMLVTPETKLLYGIDNPSLAVVESLPGYQERSRAVSIALHRIARELGCNLEDFQARGGGRG